MSDFGTIEDTLFVPMLGRIYAHEHFPHILHDKKAFDLKDKLPSVIKGQDTQTQYTLLAGAVRSANMDRFIRNFMQQNPDGIIAELGCGLETTFYRNDNGKNLWYEIDLPDVIRYRTKLLGCHDRDRTIAADAFSASWIKQIRNEHPSQPILVTASGLFYYFEYEKVLGLLRQLKKHGNIEVIFDTVNSKGMKQMGRYMKQVGHADAAMYFYVDRGSELADAVCARLLVEEPYYRYTEKKGLKFITSATMRISDRFNMVKMIHLKLQQ